MRIKPFAALRPPANRAAVVSSPPYDVVSRNEAAAEIARCASSFMRVLRPEATLPEEVSTYADEVYTAAADALTQLQAEGALQREETPCIYLYRQSWQGRSQIGVVCCCHVDDYEQDVIKKHEKTRKAKEDDRTRHVLTTNSNAGPVFLTYRDTDGIDKLVDDDSAERPLFHFIDPTGVTHTGWIARDSAPYVDAFAAINHAYVADGHHRSASAARAADTLRTANLDSPDAEYEWFLSVLFPASQLSILPYNRVIKDLGSHDVAAVLDHLRSKGTLESVGEAHEPTSPGSFGVYVGGGWHVWSVDPQLIGDDPVGSLDCALLETHVLAPLLDIHDLRTDPRIDFVGGIRGTAALQQRVDDGHAAIAFALHAVSIDQLINVADAGMCMPPKSTWFEPKLRSGLFVHQLDAPHPA